MVNFEEINLAQPWPPLPRMDLVLIRNVMIYFDVDTKKTILGKLARLLRPDGYLILGGAKRRLTWIIPIAAWSRSKPASINWCGEHSVSRDSAIQNPERLYSTWPKLSPKVNDPSP